MNYRVGQVLFVILKKEAGIYPMQVIEEITKKTLNGDETTYILRVGADPSKIIDISKIEDEIFDSAENAKNVLVERVTKAINFRVEQAVEKAKEWYPSGFEHASNDPLSGITIKRADGEQQPAQKQHKKQPGQMQPETAQLAAELAEEAMVMEVPDANGVMRAVKVKGVKLPSTLS